MFDPAILIYATANKNPVIFGELLTIASGPTMSPMFKGPVLVITGECKFSSFCPPSLTDFMADFLIFSR